MPVLTAAFQLRTTLVAAFAIWLAVPTVRAAVRQQPPDGLRAVEVKRFGIVVKAPLAWRLIRWGQNDQAFVLSLPQETGSAGGSVSCALEVAPATLEDVKRRDDLSAKEKPHSSGKPGPKLVSNRIEKLDEKHFGPALAKLQKRQVSLWEWTEKQGKRFEVRMRVINDELLYTFVLATDEAHFSAYKLDFEELFASAAFSTPKAGLQRLAGGYWLQREFLFALKLPADWKPAFGTSERALLTATGAVHGAQTDSLAVVSTPAQPLDLESLRADLPASIVKLDSAASVKICKVVPQGPFKAIEIVVETRRDEQDVTVLERQFRGEKRNYQVRVTCERAQFKRIEAELRRCLDSFREVAAPADNGML